MSSTSVIHLDRKALEKNLAFIRSLIGANTEFVSVVKGNAYGHGIETFVPLAFDCGVRSFAVFSAHEARQLLDTGVAPDRLIIMGDIEPTDLPWVIENDIEFFVFDMDRLKMGVEIARTNNIPVHMHIELNTGLNRTGFEEEQWPDLSRIIRANRKYLKLDGLCTHLAGAEDISNYLRIRNQLNEFNRAKKYFTKQNIFFNNAHIACSAAIVNYPKSIQDLVRVGIMQYGYWPSREVKMAYVIKTHNREDPLKRVISWKSRVIDIKEIPEGEYIGYGRSYLAESNMKIAIVPVGYAQGYSRSLSNLGKAIINGVRVSVVGTVNMNMASFDVTNVPGVEKGSKVTLIGGDENVQITVASFSDMSVQLNYELLTRLPGNIPRIIKD